VWRKRATPEKKVTKEKRNGGTLRQKTPQFVGQNCATKRSEAQKAPNTNREKGPSRSIRKPRKNPSLDGLHELTKKGGWTSTGKKGKQKERFVGPSEKPKRRKKKPSKAELKKWGDGPCYAEKKKNEEKR